MMGDGLPGLSPEDQLNDLADWWEVRHDDDVLFLFYDELLTEHRRCVARIAEFMELEPAADDALIDKIVEQTTHAAMAATRGPRGHDPFNEDALAALFFAAQGLDPAVYDKERTGKVRRSGGQSGQGAGLPQKTKDAVSAAWEATVGERLGFRSLEQMQAARAAELQQPSL